MHHSTQPNSASYYNSVKLFVTQLCISKLISKTPLHDSRVTVALKDHGYTLVCEGGGDGVAPRICSGKLILHTLLRKIHATTGL